LIDKEGFFYVRSDVFVSVHTYNYIADGWNPQVYPVVRFSSEYGFQSLPSMLSYSQVALDSDLSLESDFSIKRQHHLGGNLEMILESSYHLNCPKDLKDPKNFPTIIYYSQVSVLESFEVGFPAPSTPPFVERHGKKWFCYGNKIRDNK